MITHAQILAAIDAWDIGVSVGIFAAVTLLILAVFSQGGQVHVSAQRLAALATGHTDRRTVFESTALRPVVWLLLALCHRLNLPRAKAWISRQLVAAGSPNYYTAEEYMTLALLAGLATAVPVELLCLLATGGLSLVMGAIAVMTGIGLAIYQLHERASKRTRAIARRVPYTLDLIALAMGAGATFTEAVQTVVREDPDDPFHVELKAALAEIELGTTRKKALENLAQRVPLDSLQSIVASVIQAEELGTALHDVLRDEATLLRLHRTARAENAAATASVRILVPGLLILAGVVLTIFSPWIVRTVRNGGLF